MHCTIFFITEQTEVIQLQNTHCTCKIQCQNHALVMGAMWWFEPLGGVQMGGTGIYTNKKAFFYLRRITKLPHKRQESGHSAARVQ